MKKVKELLVTALRDINISITGFRYASEQLAYVLVQETIDHLDVESSDITRQEGKTTDIRCTNKNSFATHLTFGYYSSTPFLSYFPHAKIGVFGIKRTETTSATTFVLSIWIDFLELNNKRIFE